jgi:hypothetical protein
VFTSEFHQTIQCCSISLKVRDPRTQRTPTDAGDSDMFINKNGRVALASGLDVIFCVGETLDHSSTGHRSSTGD